MEIYVPGVAALVGFYGLVLGVGIVTAAVKRKKPEDRNSMILANQRLGIVLGISSLIASRMGDKFVWGTSELISFYGLAWCLVPIGYSFSLIFGALLFAKPMREAEHVTMLDPFQQHYGTKVGALMFLPALCGDLFWCATVLNALGSALVNIAGVEPVVTIGVTASVIATYIIVGGLYTVTWVNFLQLACLAVGATIATTNASRQTMYVSNFEEALFDRKWLGEIHNLGYWLDSMLMAIFGGIPWQGYFQRVLSIEKSSYICALSVISSIGCLSLMIPAAVLGIISRGSGLYIGNDHLILRQAETIFPRILQYLTHDEWVRYIGLAALSSAVMASADSNILAISSMFTRNIYKQTMRPKASEKEMDWVLRVCVIIVTFLAATLALRFDKVHFVAYACCDMIYVVLFPQLLAVVHWPSLVDSYGCLAGLATSVLIRLSGGDFLEIPPIFKFPFFDHVNSIHKFPLRTCAMLSAIFSELIVSFFTRNLLGKGYIPRCCDVLDVYAPGNMKTSNGVVSSGSGSALLDCNTPNDASPGHLSDTATTMSSSRTDVDSTPDGPAPTIVNRHQPNHHYPHHHNQMQQQNQQYQQHNHQQHPQMQQQHLRYPQLSVLYDAKALDNYHQYSTILRPNQTNQAVQTPGHTMTINRRQSPAMHQQLVSSPVAPGQILGISKGLSLGECPPPRIISPINTPVSSGPVTGMPGPGGQVIQPNFVKSPQPIIKVSADRSGMDLNLNLNQDMNHVPKKNIKGVKLIGMDGTLLRRPSLQSTFTPTPSVEMVNIFDRRQSAGSFGPASLSPVPGVEACKTHGTAMGDHSSGDQCKIKRGIVRHHSFNDTGDQSLSTLSTQATYPSMPLRSEDCRLAVRKEKKTQPVRFSSIIDDKGLFESNARPDETGRMAYTLRREKRTTHQPMSRHLSVADEKGFFGPALVSPTYSMYNSATRNCNYFISDDEAISRF